MRILVWGMGYVGTVSAACLAQMGHDVIGIEPNLIKVQAINDGRCAIAEPGLENLVSLSVSQGKLTATTDGSTLVAQSDLSLICVGTPTATDGNLVTEYVEQVAIDIARGISTTNSYHVVVVRSTISSQLTRDLLLPLLEEHSNKQAGVDFGLVVNPEFLREGSAIADFYTPPYTIIGELDRRSGDTVASLYTTIKTDVYRVTLAEAELLKLVNNAFHALKIGFANEIGRLCSQLDIDSQKIMQLVCADTKLNISPAYLRPGFAFGGSCLPKDLRFLTFKARCLGEDLPILESILPSNQLQIAAVWAKVHDYGVNSVGILGLSFKMGTDDLRESPAITLARLLQEDGLDNVGE
jgi:GDP-mannose 6-dehydrogenase